jgi:hypothetical protein
LLILGLIAGLIYWLSVKFCCKKKADKVRKPPQYNDVVVQAAKPKVVVDNVPAPITTYSTPVYHELAPVREEQERVLVETRRWSPGREKQVEYHNEVDWARQSRTKFEAQQSHYTGSNVVLHEPTVNYVSGGNVTYERPAQHVSYTTGNVVERVAPTTSYTTGNVIRENVVERAPAHSYTSGNVVRVSHQHGNTASHVVGGERRVIGQTYNPFDAAK